MRLSQLRDFEVDVAWHEAVALVLEIIDRFVPAGSGTVPALSDITISREGTIELLELPSLRGAAVPLLARLLGELLGSAGPPELKDVVTRSEDLTGPDADNVDELRSALQFFERPNRAAVLTALGERADNAAAARRASQQLQELTARAREDAGQAKPASKKPKPKASHAPARFRKAISALLMLVVVGVLGAAIAVFWSSVAGAPVQGQPGLARRAVDGVKSTIKSGVESVLGTKPQEPAPVVEKADERRPAPARRERRRTIKADGFEPPVVVITEEQLEDGAREAQAAPPAEAPGPPEAPGPAQSAAADATTVFDDSNPELEPPLLLRPALPTEPPANVPDEEIGTLDLLIGADGRVERVQLVSPTNRYQERMLLAAAKAWVFTPAMKDGRPVRCRTRIRVTL